MAWFYLASRKSFRWLNEKWVRARWNLGDQWGGLCEMHISSNHQERESCKQVRVFLRESGHNKMNIKYWTHSTGNTEIGKSGNWCE